MSLAATGSGYGSFSVTLPGVDRRRTPAPYSYRVTYRAPDAAEPGCVMTWRVAGGREPYQVSLERLKNGRLRWHCDCADAVYRSDDDPKHRCKHVLGLLAIVPPVG